MKLLGKGGSPSALRNGTADPRAAYECKESTVSQNTGRSENKRPCNERVSVSPDLKTTWPSSLLPFICEKSHSIAVARLLLRQARHSWG